MARGKKDKEQMVALAKKKLKNDKSSSDKSKSSKKSSSDEDIIANKKKTKKKELNKVKSSSKKSSSDELIVNPKKSKSSKKSSSDEDIIVNKKKTKKKELKEDEDEVYDLGENVTKKKKTGSGIHRNKTCDKLTNKEMKLRKINIKKRRDEGGKCMIASQGTECYEDQEHQKFVRAFFIRKFLHTIEIHKKAKEEKQFIKDGQKGMLFYHELGSGKTCTSLRIALAFLKGNIIDKVYVLSPGSLRDGWITEYCKVCGGDEKTLKEKFIFITYNYGGKESAKLIDNLDFNKSLIIIDEVHNVINRVKNNISSVIEIENYGIEQLQGGETKFKKDVKNEKVATTIYNKIIESNCLIIALSGTPIFNNIYEWPILQKLLDPTRQVDDIIFKTEKGKKTKIELKPEIFLNNFNTLDNGGLFPKNPQLFIDKIKDLISYFPGKEGFYPKVIHKDPIQIRMNPTQNSNYFKVAEQESKTRNNGYPKKLKNENKKEFDKRVNRYIVALLFVNSRVASNCFYPIPYNRMSDSLTPKGWINKDVLKNLALFQNFSPKICAVILNIINNINHKHVVFSFVKKKGGVNLISNLFALCGIKSLIYSGDVGNKKERAEILRKFNDPLTNRYGQIYKILLITTAGAEGITVLEATHMHILESSPRPTLTKQAIGRVVRYKSHYYLPKEEQVVYIWRYWSICSYDKPFFYSYNNYEGELVNTHAVNLDTVDKTLFINGRKILNQFDSFLYLLKLASIEQQSEYIKQNKIINWDDIKLKIEKIDNSLPIPPPPAPYPIPSEEAHWWENIPDDEKESNEYSSISPINYEQEKFLLKKCDDKKEWNLEKTETCSKLLCSENINSYAKFKKWALKNHPDKNINNFDYYNDLFQKVNSCVKDHNLCCLDNLVGPIKDISSIDRYNEQVMYILKNTNFDISLNEINNELINQYKFNKDFVESNIPQYYLDLQNKINKIINLYDLTKLSKKKVKTLLSTDYQISTKFISKNKEFIDNNITIFVNKQNEKTSNKSDKSNENENEKVPLNEFN
jgi:hypothetical protein